MTIVAIPIHQTAWLLIAVTLGFAGCVERTISITSNPQGALVYLNDEEVGRTPLAISHRFYGVYSVRLELDDHKPLWTKQEAKAPWWEFPGPDLVAEAIPGLAVRQQWHFDLDLLEDLDPSAIEKRAQQLSQMLEEKP